MAFVRWKFTDLATGDTYTLPVNPSEGGTPSKSHNILELDTTAPDGASLLFEGRDKPQQMDFSGFIRYEAEYDALDGWYRNRNPVRITNDLGRHHIVIFESFEATRKHSVSHQWRHDYKISAKVLVSS